MNISFKSATLFSLLATYASVVHASLSEVTYYLDTEMAADPAAVPSSAGSMSTGTGTVTVKNDGTVTLDIRWELRGNDGPIDNTNALAGIHIHKGDQNTNGPIVFGFCGQDPLPSFGGTCQQGWSYQSAQTATQYAGQICDMAPPAPCYNDGQSTAEEAAQALIDGQEEFYVNIHTTRSIAANGDAGPLGLIRGQLRLKEEARPMDSDDEVASTITRTSREMKSALRGGYM